MTHIGKCLALPMSPVVGRLLVVFCFWLCQAGTAAAQPSWQKTWDQTVAAAKKESTVAVIGPPPATLRGAIMKFQEAFPGIRVEYAGMRAAG